MHKMHEKSVTYGQMKAMQNTFFDFYEISVALFKYIYYNVNDFKFAF